MAFDRFKQWKKDRIQSRCLHWWDDDTTIFSYEESYGPVVCVVQQKTDLVTVEQRNCGKCGLIDERTIGREFIGWLP